MFLMFLMFLIDLKTLKTLKTKRPRDLDKQSQKVHVFKNIKNNSLKRTFFFKLFLMLFNIKTLKTIP